VKLAVSTVFNALDKMTGPMNTMTRGVDRFSRNASAAGARIGATWNRLRGVFRGVMIAVTTGVAAKALGDFAARGDDIADVSKRIGMSAEALQEFRYAANMADLSADDLTSILQKMNNQMGQLGTGTGALYSFLKRSNPQLALQLKTTKSSEKAFTLLMDAIAAETDVAKRAALAQAAFGKSGQEVIDMAAGLEEKRKEAQASGTIISNEDVQRAAEMHTNLLRLQASGTGFINQVLGRAVAAIAPLLERLNAWISANREIIGQKIDAAINFIATAAKTAYDIFTRWSPVILAVVGGFIAFNVAMKAAAIISVVSKAISVASAVMAMFQAGASIATVAQWAFNAAVAANPIMWIAMAIAALILGIVLLAKNWGKVTAAFKAAGKWIADTFRSIRDWIYKALDNPIIRAAALIFAPFITLPILIAKNWGKIKLFFVGMWEGIKTGAGAVWSFLKMGFFTVADIILSTMGNVVKAVMSAVSSVGSFLGFDMSGLNGIISKLDEMQASVREQSALGGGGATPVSPNTGIIASNVTTTNRSNLDVNFNNLPSGTEMRQTGQAPGITVRTGPTMNMMGVAH
jgi:hypothetical protein